MSVEEALGAHGKLLGVLAIGHHPGFTGWKPRGLMPFVRLLSSDISVPSSRPWPGAGRVSEIYRFVPAPAL